MAYTILKSDGTVFTTIADGTRDTTSSISLAGPNFVGYGQDLNENLLHMLENFAGNSAPGATNLQGQLWFDRFNQVLKVFTNLGYVPVSGVTNATSRPIQGKNGDIWFNSTTEQMYVYDDITGTPGFKLIGPVYTRQTGITGAIADRVEDGSISGTFHEILKLQYGNLTYATISADAAFLPTPAIPGFTFINPGITFSSNVIGPTINANVTGSVFGTLFGPVFGNVSATTLSGTLTGNVNGSVSGISVSATNLAGNLYGNAWTTTAHAANFSSGNIRVSGGFISALANITANSATIGTTNITTLASANFSSANAQITGGSATGLLNTTATTAQAANFSSANAQITGGSATGLTNISGTTAQAANFSSANAQITGGNITGLTNAVTTNLNATNFSGANVLIASGDVNGLTTLSTYSAQATILVSANAQITGGNVSGVTGANVTLFASNIQNGVATTRNYNDSSTAIATTAFVQSVLPQGVILMWGGSVASIPNGWQLCNGSNGTPDLRDRFIVGAGTAYVPGATGGANSVTLDSTQLPIHAHGLTGTFTSTSAGGHSHSVSDPGHAHAFSATLSKTDTVSGGGITIKTRDDGTTTTTSAVTGISIASVADHQHNITLTGNTQTTGGTGGTTQPHENRPPYYALCYIQKMY